MIFVSSLLNNLFSSLTNRYIVSQDDWCNLSNMALILKNFADATLATEGHASSIDLTLQSMDFLLYKFEQAKAKYELDPFLGPCCNAGWKKLDKYYSMTDRTPAYSAALVLCPHLKWIYFEREWPAAWVTVAKEQVEALWLKDYKNNTVSELSLKLKVLC